MNFKINKSTTADWKTLDLLNLPAENYRIAQVHGIIIKQRGKIKLPVFYNIVINPVFCTKTFSLILRIQNNLPIIHLNYISEFELSYENIFNTTDK